MVVGSLVTSFLSSVLIVSFGSCLICANLLVFSSDDDGEDIACNPDGLTDEEARASARHEAGHSIVARDLRPEWFRRADLFPTGIELEEDVCATGLTTLDFSDFLTRDELRDRIAIAYGGYAADIQYRSQPVTGSSRDIDLATQIAIAAIDEYGLGHVVMPYNHRLLLDRNVPLPPELGVLRSVEIRSLLDESLALATEIVQASAGRLETFAEALLEAPDLTLTAEDADQLFAAEAGLVYADAPISYE